MAVHKDQLPRTGENSAFRAIVADSLKAGRLLASQGKKLVAGFFILSKRTQHGTCDRSRMLLLDASHHHAEMTSFAYHADSLRFEDVLNGFGDFLRHPL